MKEESFEVRLAPSRMSLVTGVILFALLSYSLTSNMLTPLLPGLEKAYQVSPVTAIWIVLVTLLAGAVFVPSLCRLGDVYDAKKGMVLIGLGSLVVGGVFAAVSPGLSLLFVGRALQGVGLLVFPMAAGVVNDEFPVLRRKLAMGLMSAALFVGIGVGGVLAAVLVERSDGFRLVFWMSAALPLVAMPLVAAFVPRGRSSLGRPGQWWREIDLPGAVGFAVPAIALVIALSRGSTWGWTSPAVVILFVVAAVTFAAWVIIEGRVAKPLVDMKIFFSRPLWVNNSVAILGGFGLVGGAVATSTFVQLPPVAGVHGFGLRAVQGALIILPAESMMLLVGPIVGYLSRRTGKGLFLTGGVVVQMLGFVLLLAAHSSIATIFLSMVVVGIGSGSVAASFGLIYVEDVPREHVGRLFGISPILANGVGGSLAGAVFAAVLTSHTVPGTKLPSEAGFETFWTIAVCVLAAGAVISSVYLVTYWAGLRGGDRAMVRRERARVAGAASVPAPAAE